MILVQPSVEIIDNIDGEAILKKIELCGRVCYKSEDKIMLDSAKVFVAGLLKRGHESVIEHVSFSVRFICDRGVSHEIVRHRIASFSMSSTRYCNFGHDGEIAVIEPSTIEKDTLGYISWQRACEVSEMEYMNMIENGYTPQQARAVLPNSLKTELIMTANLREWRHFLKLRTSKAAHPDMRVVAIDLLHQVKNLIPIIFDDILEDA